MASSSLLLSPLSSTATENCELSCNSAASVLLHSQKLVFTAKPRKSVRRCGFKSAVARKSLDHIPKQFREENLKDGFLAEGGFGCPVDSISSACNYLSNGGMWSLSDMNERGPSKYSMSVSMYRGGARGYGRPRTAPPDLPSLLLDARIVYLGMPIVPAVTELLVAQFMWLDYDSPTKPIYLYINSSGTQNEKMETVGSETEAYAVADTMAYCKSDVYTVNCGMAYGQSSNASVSWSESLHMVLMNGLTQLELSKLYLPKVNRSSGAVIDMWIKAKELDANTDYYLELLAKGIGKPKEEIEKDIQRPKYFQAQEAIDYGIADKIIDSQDAAFEKRNYEELLAQSKAMRRTGGIGPQAAPSGFR
ncbi:hypothetical protein DH2020_006539 [Rehmannia glutinosa]|uniref:ATP-dependent Clp protease proteolytic subunit n=1 Tax=Rehmannia glutinosa TaxID=99300 RepID=A0ABR0XJ50_REHGL